MLKRTITFLLVSLSIFSISTKNTFASNYNIGFEPSFKFRFGLRSLQQKS